MNLITEIHLQNVVNNVRYTIVKFLILILVNYILIKEIYCYNPQIDGITVCNALQYSVALYIVNK